MSGQEALRPEIVEAATRAVHDARWAEGAAAGTYVPFEQEHAGAQEYCRRLAIAALSIPQGDQGWRPIETAPEITEIDIWVAGIEEDGWLIRGEILSLNAPTWIKVDGERDYWPHENGGYATHWRPLPDPPALKGSQS